MLQSLIQEAGVLRPKARSKHANWIHTTFKNQRPIIFRILITTFYNHSLAPQKKKKKHSTKKKERRFYEFIYSFGVWHVKIGDYLELKVLITFIVDFFFCFFFFLFWWDILLLS